MAAIKRTRPTILLLPPLDADVPDPPPSPAPQPLMVPAPRPRTLSVLPDVQNMAAPFLFQTD
jgi:hypothetical protein